MASVATGERLHVGTRVYLRYPVPSPTLNMNLIHDEYAVPNWFRRSYARDSDASIKS